VVREAEAGLIVPPGDAAALAAAIVKLAENPETCARMGANARRYFEKNFTLDRAHEQFRALLSGVTPEEAGRRAA
jgi:glycosyltransferase involved in cell wall biosynthesis